MGAPTPQVCSAYLECAFTAFDSYAAVAAGICLSTPDDRWSNCVRNCLLAKYRCNQSQTQNAVDHAVCFAKCALRGLPQLPRLPKFPRIAVPSPSLLSEVKRWLFG
jgi:hypothetical protein